MTIPSEGRVVQRIADDRNISFCSVLVTIRQ
jgi:hypothetical protein